MYVRYLLFKTLKYLNKLCEIKSISTHLFCEMESVLKSRFCSIWTHSTLI